MREQEATLKQSLVETLKTHSLIVSGYSGRDHAVMQALEQAIGKSPGPTKVYWCGFSDSPSPPVAQLIAKARAVGREAFYVPGVRFDDLMVRLATICASGELGERAMRIIGSVEIGEIPKREPFSLPQAKPTGLIKSNAWPIRCPAEMFAFDLQEWPKEKRWQWLSTKASPHEVLAVPLKKQVVAFGTLGGRGGWHRVAGLLDAQDLTCSLCWSIECIWLPVVARETTRGYVTRVMHWPETIRRCFATERVFYFGHAYIQSRPT